MTRFGKVDRRSAAPAGMAWDLPDLAVLARLIEPDQPLANWRTRLAPEIAGRHALQIENALRIASRIFSESPKGFQPRLEALWASGASEHERANQKEVVAISFTKTGVV